ncbi:MAG: EF-P lysine aminoacylase GenX [Bdellovibrionales bacterium]|nr:EF-P lysine aminoacylase GenX [Bdellovibrionales bacterium]
MLKGRIIALRHSSDSTELGLRNLAGESTVIVSRDERLAVGDLVEIDGGAAKVLTATKRAGRSRFAERVLDPRRLHALRVRAQVESGIREFFLGRGFLETRTPLLVPCPGMEIHIRPFRLETGAYLPTSPEFAMKRLLVGGLEKIFQICPSFRYEPNSNTHHPEFTMLEWYRAYSDVAAIQADTEALVESLAIRIHGKPELRFQGRTISVKTPWPRLRVRELFADLGVDLVGANSAELLARECARLGISTAPADTWDDLYFRIWLNLVEPKLPADRAVFVERYPKSQAALAVVDRDADGSVWAKRFEFYIAGLELGNAFEELTDATEQRARFERDMRERTAIYGAAFSPSPLDEDFLAALEEGLPPSGGIAVGVDRLVMLLADEPELDRTIWLPSYAGFSEPKPDILEPTQPPIR